MDAIESLHQKLVDHYGDTSGKKLLDYGCGRAGLTKVLLEKGTCEVWAVDADQSFIAKLGALFPHDFKTGRLKSRVCESPTQLSTQFDGIFCHNVLECIENKREFIKNLYDLLKPGGTLIISHHDFDSALFNSSFVNLARKLAHHFADEKQPWQKFSDGQMGRKLPGIISSFPNVNTQTWRWVETSFKEGDYGFMMAEMIKNASKKNFDASSVENWFKDLEAKAKAQDYYFAIDVVVCKVSKA